jgi:hypothetical protein
VTVLNGLDALDNDRNTKLANRRPPRPVPAPKKYAPATEVASSPTETPAPDIAGEPVVVDVREEADEAPQQRQRPGKAPKRQERPRSVQNEPATDEGPLRAAQLYLDGTTDDHLRRIKAAALIEGSDVTNSAVVRRAVAELVERHGYDGIVRLIDNDPRTARGKGRPRR